MKVGRGVSDMFFPVPAALVVSGIGNEANVMTVAWIGMMSSSPPTLGISVRQSRHSIGLIRKEGEFTVNIPSATYFKEVDYCGLVSGRDFDKFKEAGFTPVPGSEVGVPMIQECPYNIECMFLGEIVETQVDADLIDSSGSIDVKELDPLVYCTTIREYWQLGTKLGDGFNAGKSLVRDRKHLYKKRSTGV
jgi:flavin reductase (DIM6/NTAB) family NADH-FMN oxidoreductase RutF